MKKWEVMFVAWMVADSKCGRAFSGRNGKLYSFRSKWKILIEKIAKNIAIIAESSIDTAIIYAL